MTQDELKKMCAEAAMKYVEQDAIIGVGTGSTVNYFIDALVTMKNKIEGTVASSIATEERLKAHGIRVYDLNAAAQIDVYIDGADEVNDYLDLVKGGGGALTREKIAASASKKFVCIADASKKVAILGQSFPIPLEVIPMARSYVAREIVKLGADPILREGVTTDNGNIILDIHNLNVMEPLNTEKLLNNITGTVTNGIFAQRRADILLLATDSGVETILPKS